MTAPNHAITGALIGLTIGNPAIALPLAFLSHFVCDALPHYDAAGTALQRISSKRLIYEQVLVGGAICFLIVLVLASTRPVHWVNAALGAFLAASPDLFWIPRLLYVRRTKKDIDMATTNWFWKFHDRIQWYTGPKLIWLEAIWFIVFGGLVISKL
jgi:hypothetical protein